MKKLLFYPLLSAFLIQTSLYAQLSDTDTTFLFYCAQELYQKANDLDKQFEKYSWLQQKIAWLTNKKEKAMNALIKEQHDHLQMLVDNNQTKEFHELRRLLEEPLTAVFPRAGVRTATYYYTPDQRWHKFVCGTAWLLKHAIKFQDDKYYFRR